MDTYKIIITVAGLGLAFLLSVIAELLCKAQATRRDTRATRRQLPELNDGVETQEDETASPFISQGS